jgi:hypothetical protein
MNTLARPSIAPAAVLSQARHATQIGFAPLGELRGPVLPSRGASRQLELPFLAQPPAPRHKLRTG